MKPALASALPLLLLFALPMPAAKKDTQVLLEEVQRLAEIGRASCGERVLCVV